MSFKTFFQPWLIQPAFPSIMGEVTEYDPLQDAYDLSVEAGSWAVDILDQLTYANELYVEAAEASKVQMAYQKDRRSAALGGIAHNKKVMAVVNAVVASEPIASALGDVILASDGSGTTLNPVPEHEDTLKYADDTPWYVPTVKPEPVVTPKRRSRRQTTDE